MNNIRREVKALTKQEEIQQLVNEYKTISQLRRDAYGRLVKANRGEIDQQPDQVWATYMELTKYRETLLDKLAEFGITVDRQGRIKFPDEFLQVKNPLKLYHPMFALCSYRRSRGKLWEETASSTPTKKHDR